MTEPKADRPARTCAWCSRPNDGRNPFYCPDCVKLHWSKAERPPDELPPPTPLRPKHKPRKNEYSGDYLDATKYPV